MRLLFLGEIYQMWWLKAGAAESRAHLKVIVRTCAQPGSSMRATKKKLGAFGKATARRGPRARDARSCLI